MATEDNSRRIVRSGLAPGGPASETAITLVDDAGNTLQSARVDEDGSCALAEEALASAQEVVFGPINVGIRAQQFRALLESEDPVDVAALLAGFAPATRRGMAGIASPDAMGHPRSHGRRGW
jgi:hypothetical protein